MKKFLTIALLICVLLSPCSYTNGPKVYDDPFLQAKDGQIVLIGEEQVTFTDPASDEPIPAMCDFNPYSETFTFIGVGVFSICLVHVKTIRNIERLKYTYETEDGPKDVYDYTSVVELEIADVFIDDRKEPLLKGDIVRAYSLTSSKRSYNFPVLSEGDTYYVVLAEMDTLKVYNQGALTESLWQYFATLGDYIIGATHQEKWQLHENGMVEIPAEMMDYGDAYWKSTNYQYRLVPQAEFEAFLRERSDYYKERRLTKIAKYEELKALIVEKESLRPSGTPTGNAP